MYEAWESVRDCTGHALGSVKPNPNIDCTKLVKNGDFKRGTAIWRMLDRDVSYVLSAFSETVPFFEAACGVVAKKNHVSVFM